MDEKLIPVQPSTRSKPMHKLLNGEQPLWFTYWISFTLPVCGYNILLDSLDRQVAGTGLLVALYSVFFLYLLAMLRAVWLSANAYQGGRIWKLAAKASVVLNVAGIGNVVIDAGTALVRHAGGIG